MTVARRPAVKKAPSKTTAGTSHQSVEKRRVLTEKLQKIRAGSEVLTAELERLRQRLAPRS